MNTFRVSALAGLVALSAVCGRPCRAEGPGSMDVHRDGAMVPYTGGGNRDPFVPLVTGGAKSVMGIDLVETVDDVRLEGIIMEPGGGSMAVINDTLINVGETQYAVTLKDVGDNSVLLKIHDKEYTVYLITEGGE